MPHGLLPPFRGRFAPTPSGPLHGGNLRTALLAWLFARQAGASFALRIEDLDRPRMVPGAAEEMIADLHWLGLDWDEGPDTGGPHAPYRQSERGTFYREHLDRLLSLGLVYPCYCSRADIAGAASAPNAPLGAARPYSGACRDPERREQRRRAHPERQPSYRFKLESEDIQFSDAVHGQCLFALRAGADDFIVWRADGTPAYQLAVVVDDALMRIGQVVRGDDLLDSTPRQLALYRAFAYPPPSWVHVPLLHGADGARLAKRERAEGVAVLRAAGAPAEMVVGELAASLGLVPAGTRLGARGLLAIFDPANLVPQPGL